MWTFAFALPLLLSVVITAAGLWGGDRSARVRDLVVRGGWVAVLPAAAALLLDDGAVHDVPWMLLGTAIRVDAIALPLGLMAVAVYGLALAFVVRSKTGRPQVLMAFLLVCFVGNLGVFVAANVVTFYLAFAAMSFLGYAIVVHDCTDSARRAGAIYLILTVFGESAVLAALMFITADGGWMLADVPAVVAASDSRDLIILLLLIGFGVKAGTVPLHVWLPLAHPAAPSPASAVLSGVMLKAGIVGWLRFLPLGEAPAEPLWGSIFLGVAIAGGLLAVPVGLLQDNPKVILAYSSIGQMGFLTMLVGVALLAPALAPVCIAATVVYSVAHGLIKAPLFLGVQAWDSERLRRWAVAIPLAAASLALAGAPFTAGFVAKYTAKEAVGAVALFGPLAVPVADILPWTAVGSTLLLSRFAVVMWRRPREPRATAWSRDIAWALLCLGAVVPVAVAASASAPPLTLPSWTDPVTLWAQSWPVLLGLAAAVGTALLAARRRRSRVLHPRGDIVPPGDIITAEERAARGLLRVGSRGARGIGALTAKVRATVVATPTPAPVVAWAQRKLGGWAASGVAVLLLLAVALALAAVSGGWW
ncbi:complex I subunit 5 family protein [Microbacterium aurantiacum]|uniref:complex I subunit 5 family protein n=1 Tax=Microbacterium aurantiacum TaxID=162393 RepID=UPI00343098DD